MSVVRTALVLVSALVVAACAVAPDADDSSAAASTSEPSEATRARSHAAALPETRSEDGALTAVTGFGANPGALAMWEHVPATLATNASNAPVVVVLHGCMEHAADAAAAGWNQLADERGFIAVYPEQEVTNNGALCFDWSNAMGLGYDDAERGHGEGESVREMAASAIARHHADPHRVYVAGFSAGAAEAVVVAALYPDVFAGAASFAGVPYGCADTLPESVACMEPGIEHPAADWGKLIRNAYPSYSGKRPKISIWQGSLDNVVYPQNQTELVKQWTNINGLSTKPSVTDTVDGHAHQAWTDASGDVVVETYLIEGMWHGMPVDPASGCGVTSSFAFDFGICGPRRAAELFGL